MSSIAAVVLASCAAQAVNAPSSLPASAPTFGAGFVAVPAEWCAPIDGVFLSWQSVDDELLMRRKEHEQCEVRVINAEERADIAEVRAKAAQVEAAAEHSWWTRVGLPVLVGVAASVVGGVVGYAVKR